MGIAVDFKGTNITFTAPEGNQEVRSLKAYTNGSTVVQCWQFTKEELEEIQRTGKVFITLPVRCQLTAIIHRYRRGRSFCSR